MSSLVPGSLYQEIVCALQAARQCSSETWDNLQQQRHEHKLPRKRPHVDNWAALVDSKDQIISTDINARIM